MTKLYVADTNIILDYIEQLDEYKIVLTSHVLRELEKHKSSKYEDLKYRARVVSRYIKDNIEKFEFDAKDYNGFELGADYDYRYEDNNILACCVKNNYSLISNDVLLTYKAKGFGIETISFEDIQKEDESDYKGYREIFLSPYELDKWNELDSSNPHGLLVNEYLIVKDIHTKGLKIEDQRVLDAFKYDGNFYNRITVRGFKTELFGQINPLDIYQQCVLDSLEDNQVTMIRGKAGSGKSLMALSYAMKKIEKGKKDKLICFVNPVASKNSAKLGYYKGSRDEKLLDSSIGTMLGGKFGNKIEIERMIQESELMLLPFSDLRGFDTTGMNAIILVLEAQNLDIPLMKLAMERIGEDCEMIIDGDFNAQVDSYEYEGKNNGMRRLSQVYRGENYYGEIELPIVHRSRISKKAQEM